MPIEHEKRITVPVAWAGMEMLSVPDEGRSFSTPSVGMTNDREQE
jgi:hypothetical protein